MSRLGRTTEDKKATGREIHTVTRRLAASQKWPDAPDNMQELMTGWPSYNARTLPLPDQSVLRMNLLVNESYSGTGNGAVSLHQQWRAIGMEARKQLHAQPEGQVITETACDVDPVCRDVLKALPKDCSFGGRVLFLIDCWELGTWNTPEMADDCKCKWQVLSFVC